MEVSDADAKADLAGEPRPDNPSPEATAMQKQEPAKAVDDAKAVFGEPVNETPTPPAPEMNVSADLDTNGLPWDERIHAGSKTKDVKGYWKYKRGVDRDVLVPEVEAELKDRNGAAWDAVDADSNAQPGAPVGEIVDASVTPPAPPAPLAAPSSEITTFAQLVTAITAKSITEEKVKEALDKVRVGNFALLGARPDLIPTVAGHLGL